MKISLFETVKHSDEVYQALKTSFEFLKNNNDISYCENANEADFIISFGGDGTLLDCFQKFPSKKIIPIRDYNQCSHHLNLIPQINELFVEDSYEYKDILLINSSNSLYGNGLSEFIIRNEDLSKAIRFDILINEKMYAKNCIGDGIILSTSLGSTGYFKNITRMFFTQGMGIAFLNNAQNLVNMILTEDTKVSIVLKRGDAKSALDHHRFGFPENTKIDISFAKEKAILIGYKKNFMCEKCRNERHSAYVNDFFKVI